MTRKQPQRLDGKVVVITGAASGIGRALALDAAGRGARLALSDWDGAGLEETVAMLDGAEVLVDKLDVRDRAAMASYAARVAEHFAAVHLVVNNAGVALNGDFAQVSYEQIERVVDIDFWGVVHGSKEFLPHLIASGSRGDEARLVNISSLFGIMAVPGQSAYNAAKFAVRGLTEALRQEMVAAGHPVTVTCVHPGGIKTAIARNAEVVGADQAEAARFFDKHLAKTSAETAARVILDAALAGKPRVLVGGDAKALDAVVRLTGAGYQRLVTAAAKRATARLV